MTNIKKAPGGDGRGLHGPDILNIKRGSNSVYLNNVFGEEEVKEAR